MPTFALVTEGLTDQIILEEILFGFFDDPDLVINSLQPLRDATDANRAITPGNWHQVLEYCASAEFRGAFQFNNYVIIQIDTDVCQEYHVSPRNDEGNELSPSELIERVKLAIISQIGGDFYQKVQSKVLFAIAVHSIECWLLPLYFKDKKREKIKNCLGTLNQALSRKEGFTIDSKDPDYYRKVAEPYSKKKTLMQQQSHNPSLNRFVVELGQVNRRAISSGLHS